jgi:hypothetical protein
MDSFLKYNATRLLEKGHIKRLSPVLNEPPTIEIPFSCEHMATMLAKLDNLYFKQDKQLQDQIWKADKDLGGALMDIERLHTCKERLRKIKSDGKQDLENIVRFKEWLTEAIL